MNQALLTFAPLLGFASVAQASIIPIGSSLTFGGNDLPDTSCSDTVTFSSMAEH